jgi:hypothetical protein
LETATAIEHRGKQLDLLNLFLEIEGILSNAELRPLLIASARSKQIGRAGAKHARFIAERREKARRFLRRARSLSEAQLDRELRSVWRPFLESLVAVNDEKAERAKRKETVLRNRPDRPGHRLSLLKPSRSTIFGSLVLEPLWQAIESRADDMPKARLAELVRSIVVAYFGPRFCIALTADGIRKRIEKARRKK